MKKCSKYIKNLFSTTMILFLWFWFFSTCIAASNNSVDLLRQVFSESISYDSVIIVWWDTAQDVWQELLIWWNGVGGWDSFSYTCLKKITDTNKQILYDTDWNKIDNEADCTIAGWTRNREILEISYEYPLIVRIAKILLRLTTVLSITMIIFVCVKMMINVFNWKEDTKWFKKDIIGIVVWLLVALFSVTIINLIRSVPYSSIATSNDTNENESIYWCKFSKDGQTMSLPLVQFKEYLCLHEIMWYEDNNLNSREFQYIGAYSNGEKHMDKRGLWSNRCKVISWWTRKRVIIKDNTAKNYCKNIYNGSWWINFTN